MFSILRQYAKTIPLIYWLGGFVKYIKFLKKLRESERNYNLQKNMSIPPPMLRYRVHRSFDEAGYYDTGKYVAEKIVTEFTQMGVQINGCRILDFACGPGRVLMCIKELRPGAILCGTDIDSEAILWASKNLPDYGKFIQNNQKPPLQFPEDSFDAIYCISLFTHLDVDAQDMWLQELCRILRSDGLLLTTVHGKFTYSSCTQEEVTRLASHGIAFRAEHKGKFKLDGLPDFYQTTFHTKKYVLEHWARFMDVVKYEDGGIHNHQDIVVLKKRKVQRKESHSEKFF